MPQPDISDENPCYLFTREEADRLVTAALDTSPCEPEPFVKLLLILLDHVGDRRLKDSIYLLIKVAYDESIVHSTGLAKYMEAIRQGHNPAEQSPA